LNAQEVGMWTEMPFWISEDMNGLLEINIQKALDAGLTFRPLEATARDVREWNQTRTPEETRWGGALGDKPPKAGMTPERETALLQQWHARAAQEI
jgi:2'-hydroxyisoflavone reductase